MSQLRLGRLPDGTREIRILGYGDVGRMTHSRLGIRGGGEPIVTPSGKHSNKVETRTGAHKVRT